MKFLKKHKCFSFAVISFIALSGVNFYMIFELVRVIRRNNMRGGCFHGGGIKLDLGVMECGKFKKEEKNCQKKLKGFKKGVKKAGAAPAQICSVYDFFLFFLSLCSNVTIRTVAIRMIIQANMKMAVQLGHIFIWACTIAILFPLVDCIP